MGVSTADAEPTFDLPSGGASDFYFAREKNDREDENHGRIVRRHGLWGYPFLTRRTNDSLAGTNDELTSSELRHGRTASKTKLGHARSEGSLDIELSPETFDDQFEGAWRSRWVRWKQDGQAGGIAKDYLTKAGYLHVNGDDGTYNQWYDATLAGKRVTEVPLLFTGDEAGTVADPFGLIKVSADKIGGRGKNPLGKFVAHELHIGNTPVKYAAISRIPITDKTVRHQVYRHVEMGSFSLNVQVGSIVTGSIAMNGANNPPYYTENHEAGKTRLADGLQENRAVATGTGAEFFSADLRDAAERLVAAARSTTKSTDTDQFTALEGFLFINGHQIQFASGLTFEWNNNLTPVNAIFVKSAIANLSPKVSVTGSITAYFTDGERDSTGRKFGTDDLKTLARDNKDVEILFAFIDHEDPDEIYLFQVFKATLSSPPENKDADNPITLEPQFTSYGERAARIIRLAVPKVRDIEMDMGAVATAIRSASSTGAKNEVSVRVIPNVPLDSAATVSATDGQFSDADYVDATNKNGQYVFRNAEVYVIDGDGNSAQDTGASFSGAKVEADGSITAKLNLSANLADGSTVKILLTVNGSQFEKAETVAPEIPYMRMGDDFKTEKYASGYIEVPTGGTVNVLDLSSGTDAEDYLFYKVNGITTASDLVLSSSDTSVATVEGGSVHIAQGLPAGQSAAITVASRYDDGVFMEFEVRTKLAGIAFDNVLSDAAYTVGDAAAALDGTATASGGGTVSYRWTVDGTEVATTATYTPDTSAAGVRVVEVTASCASGGVTESVTQSVTVTVTG